MRATELDLHLPSGRLRAQRWGQGGGRPLAICVHGLSGNMHGFDSIGPALAEAGRDALALDLRGRGRSDETGPGTYGLRAHLADVLAAADELGFASFELVGWSMGALIGLDLAVEAPERLARLVLIDHAGRMDESAVEAIIAGLARLDAVVPSAEAYVDAIRGAGAIRTWSPFWERYYAYELEPAGAGFTPSTDRAACIEDLRSFDPEAARSAWTAIPASALLVRCTAPIAGGLIVPDEELDALRAAAPHLEVVEVDSNHYEVMDDPRAVAAIAGA